MIFSKSRNVHLVKVVKKFGHIFFLRVEIGYQITVTRGVCVVVLVVIKYTR